MPSSTCWPLRDLIRTRVTALLLATWACGSWAQGPWVPVSTRSDGDALYAQALQASSQTQAAPLEVTSLLNYGKPQWWGVDKRYQSNVARWEIQCAQKMYSSLSYTAYAGAMGSGEVVIADRQSSLWSAVTPGSIPGDLWRWACQP